jgi:fumarate hydratase subunit beta
VTGGIAALLAKKVIRLRNIYLKQFGMAEAVYEIEVKALPAIVGIDTKGNSLYKKIYTCSYKNYKTLMS